MPKRKRYREFVAKYGRKFPRPSEYKVIGHPEACFFNAAVMAMCCSRFHPPREYTYVEGFVGDVHHAWIVDAEGQVIEVTWASIFEDHAAGNYFGVPYRSDWLQGIVEKRGGMRKQASQKDGIALPSLQHLVFAQLGWRALSAGVKRNSGKRRTV